MKLIDISRALCGEAPVYPGDMPPRLERVNTIEKDKFNRTVVSMSAHSGTHIDAPNHFIPDGKAIHQLDLSLFYGGCTVVECDGVIDAQEIANVLKGCQERLLFKGQSELSEDAAALIASSHVKLVGVEGQSVGSLRHPMPVHLILLEEEIIPLEGLDLSGVSPGEYVLSAFPLNLWESDGSPVRAVLLDKAAPMENTRDHVLVFIDGTICDLTHRHHLKGTPDFEKESEIMMDVPVGDGIRCMNELHKKYDLVYIGARSEHTAEITRKWLKVNGFPDGKVVVGSSQKNRLSMVKELKKQIKFAAGIGDRWDDNELHLELGCTSIILEEYHGNWHTVRKYLLDSSDA